MQLQSSHKHCTKMIIRHMNMYHTYTLPGDSAQGEAMMLGCGHRHWATD